MGTSHSSADDVRIESDLTHRLFRILSRKKACDIEELVDECPSYTWNQIFLEIDRLSRTGKLCLLHKKAGEYAVSLPGAA